MDAEALLTHDAFVRGLARGLVLGFEDAEDVAQDAWVATLENPPRPGPGIRGWLATVTRNVVRQGRRSRLRRIAREASVARPEAVPSNETIREREATRRRVVEAVLELDEPYREAVVLRYLEGQPPRHIAEQLDVPLETVKTRLKRALARLRDRLDRETDGGRGAWTAALLPLAGIRLGTAGAAAAIGVKAKLLLGAAAVVIALSLFVVMPALVLDPEPPASVETADRANTDLDNDRPAPDSPTAPDARRATVSAADVPAGAILVVDGAGRPAKAIVLTTPESVADMTHAIELGRTNEEGLLLPGAFGRSPRRYVWARNRSGVAGPALLEDGKGVLLTLGEGGCVEGFVRTPAGKPLAGVLVDGVWSDARGWFRISRLFPGTPRPIRAMIAGWRPQHGEPDHLVTLAPGESTRNVEIVLDPPPASVLLATVVVPRGESPDEVELVFQVDGKENDYEGRPAQDGKVRVHLDRLRGKSLRVGARYPGFRAPLRPLRVPDGPEIVEVRLVLEPVEADPHALVLDGSGRPTAGVTVLLADDPEKPSDHERQDRTDKAGRIRLSPKWVGKHLLAFDEGNSVSAWTPFGEKDREVVLRLGPGAAVAGRVVDRDTGRPVQGVEVLLHIGPDPDGPELSTHSDGQGAYRFDGVPPGLLALPYANGGLRTGITPDAESLLEKNSSADLIDAGYARAVTAGDVFSRDLVVDRRPGRLVTFRILPPEGPLDVESVLAVHRYRVPGLTGSREWPVRVDLASPSFDLYLAEGVHVVRVRAGALFGTAPEIRITGDGPPDSREMALSPLSPVEVQIVHEDGKPLELRDVVVVVEFRSAGAGRDGGSSPTDSRGRAEITDLLPPPVEAEYRGAEVRFRVKGALVFDGGPWRHVKTLTGDELLRLRRAAGGDAVVLEIPAARTKLLDIPVLDADGRPVPGVRVALEPAGAFDEREALSDASGVLSVRARSTEGRLKAMPPYLGTAEIDDVLEHSGRRRGRKFRLTVTRRREILVRVVDGDGRALPRTELRIEGERRTTDEHGHVRVAAASGEVSLWVYTQGRAPARLEVAPGVEEATARLVPYRGVRVTVEAPADFRGDRIDLKVSGQARGGTRLERSSRGFSTELQILPEDVRIEAWDPAGFWSGDATATAGHAEIRIPFVRRRLHPLVVRFVDRQNRSLADRAGGFLVDRDEASFEDARPMRIRTDARGEVRIELPGGTYSLLNRWIEDCRDVDVANDIEVPRHEPLVLRATPGGLQTVILVFPGKAPGDFTDHVRATFVGADGRERPLRWTSAGGAGARQSVSITYALGLETGRIRIVHGDQTFLFDYPGRPVPAPRFEVK